MKAQTQFFTAAAATAIAGLVSAAPAQAITFKTDGFIIGDGSKVEFDFLGSYGAFQSGFGIYDVTNNKTQWLFQETKATKGAGANAWDKNGRVLDNEGNDSIINVVQDMFTFVAGNQYSFVLGASGSTTTPTVFSTNSLNKSTSWATYTDQAKFFKDLSILGDDSYKYQQAPTGWKNSTQSDLAKADGSIASLNLGDTGLIAFEDNGKLKTTDTYVHGDWNDFLVSATVIEQPGASVPEPATLAGLGIIAGAMAMTRRRKENKAS
jgi:hypothetical protein